MQSNTNISATAGTVTSFVDWSAVIAGALTVATVSLVLLLLGSGLGFATVFPGMHQGVSVTTFTLSAAIWLIVTQWISSALGGYLTGRLRSKWVDMHGDEVFFRDTAQGLLAWVIATLFTAAFLASATVSIIEGGMKSAATVGAGAVTGYNPPLFPAGKPEAENWYFIDTLFRSDHISPAAPQPEIYGEVNRLLFNDIKNDGFPDADKTYLTQLVSQRTGVSVDEASRRVDTVIHQIKEAEKKMKEKADAARKTTSAIAIMVCLSMIVGAFVASAAAALGGKKRDTF